MQRFYDDVAAAYRAEIADLAEAGCRYIQFDDTNLAYLCDTGHRQDARTAAWTPTASPTNTRG